MRSLLGSLLILLAVATVRADDKCYGAWWMTSAVPKTAAKAAGGMTIVFGTPGIGGNGVVTITLQSNDTSPGTTFSGQYVRINATTYTFTVSGPPDNRSVFTGRLIATSGQCSGKWKVTPTPGTNEKVIAGKFQTRLLN